MNRLCAWGVSSLILILFATSAARADVKLPGIFGDHMVLQREVQVPVWGWATAGEKVTVEFAGQTQSTIADGQGKWRVNFDKLAIGEPQKLTVKGNNTITLSDVLVGEVWLCSGQSNMGFVVKNAKDFDKEQAAANLPQIRHFSMASGGATKPQEDCKGTWIVCSPDTVGGFTATGYFFGRELHKSLKMPVGLINSSVGGTPIEAWTSWEAQRDFAELQPIFDGWKKKQDSWDPAKAQAAYEKQLADNKVAAEKAKADKKTAPRAPQKPSEPITDSHYPGNLFNGKINPLVPFAIRGAVWYQGESNAGSNVNNAYQLQLTTMIKDWRARWGNDFAFGWVQLPDFHAAQKEPVEDDGWVFVREGMLKTLAMPKTGMAVTLGLGEVNDIHPTRKQAVGERLSKWALGDVYGQKVETSGPMLKNHEVRGNEVVLNFTHTEGGVVAKENQLKGFAVCGENKKWVKAEAKLDGDKVVVYSAEVAAPIAVRYAWADNPEFSLFNGAGLPASPFRTDDFPLVTPSKK